MVRRYEYYFRVVKTIFYKRAHRVSKIPFSTRENSIHIFKLPCNVLFIMLSEVVESEQRTYKSENKRVIKSKSKPLQDSVVRAHGM